MVGPALGERRVAVGRQPFEPAQVKRIGGHRHPITRFAGLDGFPAEFLAQAGNIALQQVSRPAGGCSPHTASTSTAVGTT